MTFQVHLMINTIFNLQVEGTNSQGIHEKGDKTQSIPITLGNKDVSGIVVFGKPKFHFLKRCREERFFIT